CAGTSPAKVSAAVRHMHRLWSTDQIRDGSFALAGLLYPFAAHEKARPAALTAPFPWRRAVDRYPRDLVPLPIRIARRGVCRQACRIRRWEDCVIACDLAATSRWTVGISGPAVAELLAVAPAPACGVGKADAAIPRA